MAQLAFAGIGAALGSGFAGIPALGLSGAALGWSIGGMVGGLFGPSQKVQGPRLADLKLTASTYGAPIPYVFGHPRIGGQVIWGSDRREISTTTSRRAKGPKVKSTTYTYEIDLLIKLTCNRMAGIRKIFINGELQWTSSSDADFGSINASSALAGRITVYPGADDQLPDPTYEAAVGIGNAPAYRGALTIMMEALQLGNQGQIPNITFEVAQEGAETVNYADIASMTGLVDTPQAYSNNQYTTAAYVSGAVFAGHDFRAFSVDASGTVFNQIAGNVGTQGGSGPKMMGRSDRPVLALSDSALSNSFKLNSLDGAPSRTFAFPSSALMFVLRGDDLVAAQGFTGSTHALRRFDVSTNSQDAEVSIQTVKMVSSMAILEDQLYVHWLPANASFPQEVEVFDLQTLVSTGVIIQTPIGNGGAEILESDDGSLMFLNATELWRYVDGAWALEMTVAAGYGSNQASGRVSIVNPYYLDGSLYTTRQTTGSNGSVRVAWKALSLESIPLDDVVVDLCERAGIDPSFIDASGLSSFSVRAWAITPSTTRAALEAAAQAYQFEACCSDKMRFVRLGGAPVASVPFDELGSVPSGGWVEALPMNERNDIEMPAYVTVKYMNVLNDYQDGAERSSRIATESEAEQFIEVAMGLTPEEAKRTANFISNLIQASTTTLGPISLQTKYARLQPTDVVTLIDGDGSSYRSRITKAQWANGILTAECVLDNASAATGVAITDEDYEETSVIRVPSITIFHLGDWPLFRDEDDNIGHYWAATGSGPFWPGASLMKSVDDVIFEQVSQIEERGIVGSAISALGNYIGPNIPDETNVVRVSVPQATLASITYAEQILEVQNAFMIGDECIIAREASYVSPGVYDLRGLLRGRKGTEWAMGNHSIGDEVVVIQPQGVRRVGMDISELYLSRFYRAPTFGRPLDSTTSRPFTNTGVSAKPYAATNLDATRDGTNVTVTWNRRTRYSQNWLLGFVPLAEASQSWVIESYTDGTYTTIANTYTSTTNSVTFANAGTMVYLRIYQLSDRVGRGYVLQGAI